MNSILGLLSDGQFHSGEELGLALGISRASIWKGLKKLEAEHGIEVFRVPGKGYRLAERLDLLDQGRLEAFLGRQGWRVHVAEHLDSTNAEALRLLQRGVPPPFIVISECQVNGRGRRGRQWVSPAYKNLYYSLAWSVSNGSAGLAGLSLVVGLAVLETLTRCGVARVGLKWPNDIYADDKKIAGILLELIGDPADVCSVVIGVGINVNMVGQALEIAQPCISLRDVVNRVFDRNELSCLLSESLERYLRKHALSGFASMREEWESNHLWQGKACVLSSGVVEVKGRVLGVDDQGALRLDVDGVEKRFSGGELSLRLGNDS
ncbi:bifunctional biotin--[acetyl-CoA-carboxylase] ligase/biotin operon repressor BirA [Stutzerimonas chloritidismutans]|uniref:bifunctional biotin--[acetyl-CoA-carboxylase] ligase/biotin operon repressor BirA n=1 Tax=Stutzerimonas chloritidismutans TaxID=203192 RepID=UPI003F156FDA